MRAASRYVAVALIVYGAVGVAVHLRLLPLLWSGPVAWLGLPSPSSAPPQFGLLVPLQAHYDSLPWIPWAAWLFGFWILGFGFWISTGARAIQNPKPKIQNSLGVFLLPALLLVGGFARMVELWPQGVGLTQLPYDDEGVYAGASQLFLQGILPYRDYFFAHPPVAAISYAPAMAYHFNEWGSPTSFMVARYLSVAYSLVTLALLFLVGWKLAGVWAGTLAGALWALDGRVVEINRKIMLDGPMVLLSCGALLVYLWARPVLTGAEGSGPRRPLLVLALAGGLGAMSGLTKIAGAACLLAILADLLWLHLDNLRSRTTLARLWPQLGSLVAGALVAAAIFVVPFLLAAPSDFVRQVLFFQLLRPSDGLIDVPARIADITATFENALTPLFAALGFLVLSVLLLRSPKSKVESPKSDVAPLDPGLSTLDFLRVWRVVALWTFFSLLLFTYSRSFYGHYYIQLAAPLCLLGAGTSLLPGLFPRRSVRVGRAEFNWTRALPVALLLIVALPLVVVQWNGVNSRRQNRVFEILSRYITDAVPPGTPVLTTDEQFNFLAARPPSRNDTGYLIDSYGHMIYTGLDLASRNLGDLAGATLRGEHGSDAYAVLQRPEAQADFFSRAVRVPLVVIHDKGFPRLTPETLRAIEARSTVVEQQRSYTIYRVTEPEGE
jgi:hypothetical protein